MVLVWYPSYDCFYNILSKFLMPILYYSIIYNYCTWTRSIWGYMEPPSILLYSAPWNLILINWKFLKILSFWIFWNLVKFLKVLNLKKIFFKKFKKFSNLKKKLTFKFVVFNFIILNFFLNLKILWIFLTYWLAKSNFGAIISD